MGTADRIQGRECADAECDHSGGGTIGTRVALRAEAAIQFVRAVDLLYLLVRKELIQQGEIVVTRHRKMMFQPDLGKPGREITADSMGFYRARRFCFLCDWLDGIGFYPRISPLCCSPNVPNAGHRRTLAPSAVTRSLAKDHKQTK